MENFREWRRIYPAEVELVRARYDGGPWNYGPAIYEFRGDKVSRETIYVAEAWEAPEWRGPAGEPRLPVSQGAVPDLAQRPQCAPL